MRGLPYGCERCPEARPSLHYCVAEAGGEARCLGLIQSSATAEARAGGGRGEGGG